jgi:hypothetical protein
LRILIGAALRLRALKWRIARRAWTDSRPPSNRPRLREQVDSVPAGRDGRRSGADDSFQPGMT